MSDGLTFQSLWQWALLACGRWYPAVGVAKAGRRHTVGSVLEEGIKQPETVWEIGDNKILLTLPFFCA